MFRLIASNSLGTIRPGLLRKVRPTQNGLKLQSQNAADQLDIGQTPYSPLSRSNSTQVPTLDKVEKIISKSRDPFVAQLDGPSKAKLRHFEDLLVQASRFNFKLGRSEHKAHFQTVRELALLFADEGVRLQLSRSNLSDYANLLNMSVYRNRTSRLSRSSNRDSDQYESGSLNNDIMLKSAILDLSEAVLSGSLNAVVDRNSLRALFLGMSQFNAFDEIMAMWESGVEEERVKSLYLGQSVLSVVLPISYDTGKFSYEEVLKLFELNTRSAPIVHYELLASLGKIAIKAGDSAKGLDCLESILQYSSTNPSNKRAVFRSLSELHLSFIGSCKDIKIAKHFYDKVIDGRLPYKVYLKVPHVQSLLENCVDTNEPYSTILYFWKTTVTHYNHERTEGSLNSRYAILNNAFSSVFFRLFPTLTEELHAKLKEVIAIYSAIKPLDEFLVNTFLSNYTWGDKTVFTQLVEMYDTHHIPRTPVSYRICLKKMGSMDFSNAEIVESWNATLTHLDKEGFTYIPIADWAALRDATILSSFQEREKLYLDILDTYKNYHQDVRACNRFVKYWMNKPQMAEIAKISNGAAESEKVEVPAFTNLRENVDYLALTQPMLAGLAA